jgi:hypothetical protein
MNVNELISEMRKIANSESSPNTNQPQSSYWYKKGWHKAFHEVFTILDRFKHEEAEQNMNNLPTTNTAEVLITIVNENSQIAQFILNEPAIEIDCGAVTVTAPSSTPITPEKTQQ